MKNGKWMLVLAILAMLLLPATAWAAEVPEVTDEEYRYYLEYMAWDVVDSDKIATYSNNELREQIIASVEEEEPYTDFLEFWLWDDYMFEESDFGKYKAEDLERFMAQALADDLYGIETELLQKEYQVSVPENSTPQEIEELYYQTILQKDYNITEDMSGMPWYILADKYYQISSIESLQETLGESKTDYKLAELDALEKQLKIKQLQQEFGVTRDLSGYSLEELNDLRVRLFIEKEIHEAGYTGDLSKYTMEELLELKERVSLEKEIHDYGYTGDLSDYTMDELYEMASTMEYEAMEKEWEAEREAAKTRVNVQINGEKLYVLEGKDDSWAEFYTYTSDAAPVIKDGRTYIPFRAVFEALGADVSYDAATKTVTAKRGERNVSFTVGQNQYISNGVAVQMDAQTFVQNGRTFVPVRFASQALGAAVGWDADNRTVIIFERDKFINRYKGQFTVLEQYIKHWDFVGQQNLALTGSFNLNMKVSDEDYETGKKTELPLAMTMEFESLTSDTRVNYDAAVKLDLDKLVELAEQEGPIDPEVMEVLNKIKQFRVQYILDVEKGTLYLKSELLDLIQGQQNAWYSVELEDYLEAEEYQQYLDMMPQVMDELEKQAENMTVDDVVKMLIQETDINDTYDVSSTIEMLDGMYRICGDKNLGKTAQGYMHSIGSEEDGLIGKVTFLTKQDKVAGLQMVLDTTSAMDSEGMVCHFKLQEENHVLTLTGNLNLSDYFTLNCDGIWTYTATDEEPIAKPQDGSPIHDLLELLEALETEEDSSEEAA